MTDIETLNAKFDKPLIDIQDKNCQNYNVGLFHTWK